MVESDGNFLVFQWLRFGAFTREGYGDRSRIANLIRELNLEIYYFMGLLMGNIHPPAKKKILMEDSKGEWEPDLSIRKRT